MRPIYVITAAGVILGIAAAFVAAYNQDDDVQTNENVASQQEASKSWFDSFSAGDGTNTEPRCCNVATLDLQDAHYLLVSTLNGEIIAFNVNNYGQIEWRFFADKQPLVDGSFKSAHAHVIPLLDGSLFVYPSSIDGNSNIDPILLEGDYLLKSSFKLDNSEVIAGGVSYSYTGLDPLTGKVKYHKGSTNSEIPDKTSENASFHTLVVRKNSHQFRAADAMSGNERWNLSVSQYEISLASVERHVSSRQIEGSNSRSAYVNFKINQPNGRVIARDSCGQEVWSIELDSPIAKVWELYEGQLHELSLFDPNNVDDPSTIAFSPHDRNSMAFFGVYNNNHYLIPSPVLHDTLKRELSIWVNRDRANLFTTPYYRNYEVTPKAITSEEDQEIMSNELDYRLEEDMENLRYYLGLLGRPKQNYLEDKSHENPNLMCKIQAIVKGDKKTALYWKIGSLILVSIAAYVVYRRRMKNKQKAIKASSEPKMYQRNTSRESNTSFSSSEFSSKFLQEFELQKCLGRGGFGIVFECRNKLDDNSYAVKRVAVSDDENAIERVRREVKAMAKLDHPNIIRYYHTWLERPPPGWQQQADSHVLLDLNCNPSTCDAILNGNKKVRNRKKLSGPSPNESTDLGNLVKKIEPVQDVHFELISNGVVSSASDEESWMITESNGAGKNDVATEDSSSSDESNAPRRLQIHQITHGDTSSIVFEASNNNDSRTDSQAVEEVEGSETPKEEQKHIKSSKGASRVNETPPVVLVASNNSDLVTSKTTRNYVYLYIQMQLCQKNTLYDWLHIHKSWKDRELHKMRGWFTQLLDAIECIHRQGLIHRDLKPKNIFFDCENRLKVGDLGLATQFIDDIKNEAPETGQIKKGLKRRSTHTSDVGTRSYMSPEQLKGEVYDFKVDVFSLGLIYAEMLIPFGTDMERIKTLEQIQNGHIDNLKDHLPIEFDYVSWLTQQDPNKRPTCKEVLQTNFLRQKPPTSYGQVLKTTLNKLPGVRL